MNRYIKLALICSCFALAPLLMAPRNGSGTYSLPAGNPVVSGTTISSTVHNNTMSDVATALTNSLTKNGETTSTANQPMGGFRHTNVGNPTLRSQYATVDNVQDGDYVVLSSVAGTNTITGALTPAPTAYVAGMQVVLIPATANTGATTLNISSIGALDVQKWVSGAQANIVANDLRAGVPAYLVLDSGADDWILLNPNSGNLGDVTVGTATATTVATTNLTLGGNTVGGAANPSASVGLSAVNGSASTWMRSDGAPALSQAIAPTWTGAHVFALSGSFATPSLSSNNSLPYIEFDESDAAANNQRWAFYANAEQLKFETVNDAGNANASWLTVDRTGTTVDRVAFPSEVSGGVVVGTFEAALNASRLIVRTTTASAGSAQFVNATAAASTIYVHNQATAGDNIFAIFITESGGSGSTRGSIDYNRAGGATRYNTTSDIRLKKNFKPAPSARKVIDCIQVESYDWKETGYHVDHGFVAQRLNKCAPYAVKSSKDPSVIWGVDPSKLVPALIKYVQEQDAWIAQQERRIQALESHQTALLIKEVEELRSRMAKLEDEPRLMRFEALPAANRGTIEYNPAGGSVRYNVASDRRAK